MLDTLYNIADTVFVIMWVLTIVSGVIVLGVSALKPKR